MLRGHISNVMNQTVMVAKPCQPKVSGAHKKSGMPSVSTRRRPMAWRLARLSEGGSKLIEHVLLTSSCRRACPSRNLRQSSSRPQLRAAGLTLIRMTLSHPGLTSAPPALPCVASQARPLINKLIQGHPYSVLKAWGRCSRAARSPAPLQPGWPIPHKPQASNWRTRQ